MSPCTEQTLALLKLISKSKRPKLYIKKCTKSEIKTLCECVLNVIRGNVSLTKSQKNHLSQHKQSLRKLADRKIPLYKKKKILIQNGEGFIPFILPAAISLISSLINGV